MQNRLFVGNVPFQTTEDDLKELFSQAGSVTDIILMTDRFSGRSRGFAFVTMSTDAEAEGAIEQFDGQDFQGRELKVNIARPRENRG